jgi:8-oxo-dGTP pyrophosphatase MutT (NUDIX family)
MQKLFENWRKYLNEYGAAGMGGNIATIAGAGRAPMAYDNLPKTKNFELGDDMDVAVKGVLFMNDGSLLLLKNKEEEREEESSDIPESKRWREWDLPGGHMREGETKEHALKREVFEETGLQIKIESDLHMNFKNIHFFMGTCQTDDVIISSEHEDHILVRPEEIDGYDIPEDFRQAIIKASQMREA